MDDAKKQSRWVKTLDQAGLLDDIEDGWTLDGNAGDPEASIHVDGSGGKTIPPPSAASVPPRDERPVTLKQGAIDIAIVDDLPRTPIERHRSSDPAAPQKGTTRDRPDRPRIDMASARSTQSGIPRPSRIPPAALDESPAEEDRPQHERERVARTRTRISVAPGDDWSQRKEAFSPIIDEPPQVGNKSRRRPSGAPRGERDSKRQQMAERMELGDYTGALEIAEQILRTSSGDVEAAKTRDECRTVLSGMYEARIGAFGRVPVVAVPQHELIWRNLDASTGFVLSRVDGMSSFEDILDISGLPRFETCRILSMLLQDGIIR